MRSVRSLVLALALGGLVVGGAVTDTRPALAAGTSYTVIHAATGNCATRVLGTIAAALACANADNPAPTAPDTITIWGGIYEEHNLPVNSNVTIVNHATDAVVVDAQYKDDVFTITDHDVTIKGLTIMEGSGSTGGGIYYYNGTNSPHTLVLDHDTVTRNRAYSAGGGIAVFNASLSLTNVTISTNTIRGSGERGGGMAIFQNDSWAPTATFTNVTITKNQATSYPDGYVLGGGMYVNYYNGTMTLSHVSVTYNTEMAGNASFGNDTSGAGMYVEVTNTLNSSNSTYSYNTAKAGSTTYSTAYGGYASGGGMELDFTASTFTNDHIDGNRAIPGPALQSSTYNGESLGGGLYALQSPVTLTDTTVNSNVAAMPPNSPDATSHGGAIATRQTSVITLKHATIKGNTAQGNNGLGGGIYNTNQLNIDQSSLITQNSAPGTAGTGGGIYDEVGSTAASDGTNTIQGNTATIHPYENCYPYPLPGVTECAP